MCNTVKVKELKLTQRCDHWGNLYCESLYDGDHKIFDVRNLSDCPEDAIIGRDLFGTDDFIDAVKYGMKLRDEGYTDVVAICNEDEDEE